MAAGTTRVSNGAPTITAAVTAPMTALCHCHSSGEIRARHQEVPPGNAEEFRDLAADDDQADTGEIAADDRKRDVLDQAADAHETQEQLNQPGNQTERGQHQDDRRRRDTVLHEFDGKGRENCRGRAHTAL
jgi:hypothetical protein